jgi:hypothetical protein
LRAARAHAWAYYEGGDLASARELFEDILPRARATHHELVEAIALSQLADIAADEGRVADAVPMLKESQRIFRKLNDLLLIAAGVGRFASLLALAGRAATAAQVLSSSTALMEEIGARPPWFARISGKMLAVIHDQLDDAAFAEAWEQGLNDDSRRGGGARPPLARSWRRLSRTWFVIHLVCVVTRARPLPTCTGTPARTRR